MLSVKLADHTGEAVVQLFNKEVGVSVGVSVGMSSQLRFCL